MRKFISITAFLFLSFGILLLRTLPRSPRDERVAVIGLEGDASTLNPVLSADGDSLEVILKVFNCLVKLDPDLAEVVPDLAENWEWSDDHRMITFHLHKGVRWHDGQPFTSADVKFTYDTIMNPDTPTPWRGLFERIEEARTPDEHTFVLRYKEPYAPALAAWWIGILPKHLLEGRPTEAIEAFNRKPIGTGPFVFREWRAGEQLVVEANDDYFLGRPQLDRIVFRVVPEEQVRTLELLSGKLDYSSISAADWSRLKDDDRFGLYKHPWPGFEFITYNLDLPQFEDARVRRALTLAIDRQKLVRTLFGELTEVAWGSYPPRFPCRHDGIEPLPFDPDEARRLLDEAGWQLDPSSGTRSKQANGTSEPLSFKLLTGNRNIEERLAAVFLQRAWKEIGVDAKIQVVEWSTFISEHLMKHNFEALLVSFGLIPGDPDQFYVWHSSQQPPNGFNYGPYRSPEADRALEDGARSFDPAIRAQCYRRLQEVIYEDQPTTFLWYGAGNWLSAVPKRFGNVNRGVAGPTYNMEEWTVGTR